jgi:hypothetical protein
MASPENLELTGLFSRFCKLTPLKSKIQRKNPHKALILIDRGEGGYPHPVPTSKHNQNGNFPLQKMRADEICASGVATARQPAHSVLSLRSIHSTAWEGAMAQR